MKEVCENCKNMIRKGESYYCGIFGFEVNPPYYTCWDQFVPKPVVSQSTLEAFANV